MGSATVQKKKPPTSKPKESKVAQTATNRNGAALSPPKCGINLADTQKCYKDDLDKFLQKGIYGPASFTPPTKLGRFEAAYNANKKSLNITICSKFIFENTLGFELKTNKVKAHEESGLQPLAETLNNKDLSIRRKVVNKYTWDNPAIAQSFDLLKEQIAETEDLWSNRFSFFVDKPGWEEVTADVAVNIILEKREIDREKNTGKDHLQIRIFKVPTPKEEEEIKNILKVRKCTKKDLENGSFEGCHLFRPSIGVFSGESFSRKKLKNNSELLLNNEALKENTKKGKKGLRNLPKEEDVNANGIFGLYGVIFFDTNKHQLDLDAINTLNGFILKFRDSKNNNISNPIELVGHASASGPAWHNEMLANARVNSVKLYLQNFGSFTGIGSRINKAIGKGENEHQGDIASGNEMESKKYQRVDLFVGNAEIQPTVAHEFGHVFGLGDEYARGDFNEETEHSGLSEKFGAGKVVQENNDSLMAIGNVVRPQHYTTFAWALEQLTCLDNWKIKK